jgi:hypothetical protein
MARADNDPTTLSSDPRSFRSRCFRGSRAGRPRTAAGTERRTAGAEWRGSRGFRTEDGAGLGPAVALGRSRDSFSRPVALGQPISAERTP